MQRAYYRVAYDNIRQRAPLILRDQDLTAVNFHHEHSIVPTNCPWVSLGEKNLTDPFHQFNSIRC